MSDSNVLCLYLVICHRVNEVVQYIIPLVSMVLRFANGLDVLQFLYT